MLAEKKFVERIHSLRALEALIREANREGRYGEVDSLRRMQRYDEKELKQDILLEIGSFIDPRNIEKTPRFYHEAATLLRELAEDELPEDELFLFRLADEWDAFMSY